VRAKAAVILAVAGLMAMAAGTLASHPGSPYINLTVNNAVIEHNDAIYAQGGVGAGTGNFDPFLTVESSSQSPASQDGTEDGYNQCDDPGCPDERGDAPFYYDQFFGGGRTHEILVSAIPTLEYQGTLYREFSLDANDEGNDTWMSIDEIKIFVDSQVDLTTYVNSTETFGNDTGTPALEIFDMDEGDGGDQTILMVSQGLESGSGVSDVTVLVPNDLFPGDCYYGAPTGTNGCNLYLYFWTAMGHLPDGNVAGVTCTQNPCDWDVSAGFEEWRIRFLPVVNISKTADESFTREYDWTVNKTVDPETLSLFNGDSDTVTWEVTPTRDAGTDGDFLVSGTITIRNPTGAPPIPTGIDAEILSLEDVLTLDGNDIPVTDVDCEFEGDPVTFPFTLEPGDQIDCTYEVPTPSATDTSTGTNKATVTIDSGIPECDPEEDDCGGIQFSTEVEYFDTAAVNFSGATMTEIDETATLTDDRGPLDQAAVSGQTEDYDEEFACPDDEGTETNTAVVTEDDTGESDSDPASVTITCYGLTVSKTAVPSFDREYDWTITKTVSDEDIDLFNGDDQEVTWTVTWDRDNGTDSNWAVTGVITVNNPAPMAATNVSVSDALAGPVAAEVDCDPAAGDQNDTTIESIAAGGSATCDYWAALPNATTRLNTATATLFGQNYTGTQNVDFTGINPNEIDESAEVTDDRGPLDLDVNGDGFTTYNETFACGEDAGSHSNTAVVTEGDSVPEESDDDTATTVVSCYGLTVSKTATTEFTRNYDWDVQKSRVILEGEELDPSDGLPGTLVLDEGQTYLANYEIVVTMTGSTDSDWFVSGVITINNATPLDATGVSVSDVISPDSPTVEIDCDPAAGDQNDTTVDILAGGSATCDYWAGLNDASARTNVATATLNGVDYDSSAVNVTFDNTPDVEIDECVDIDDNNGTPDNESDDDEFQVCLDDLTAGTYTHSYTISIGPYETCGVFQFVNHVDLTTSNDDNDTTESDSDEYTVGVTVPCPEGCTLTPGYWKTHNDSFWGGAPTDETWFLLEYWVYDDGTDTWSLEGPGDEDSPFFLSGQSYFDVLWAKKAGNVYYNLAFHYIAAQLNMLDGADPTDAQAAFDAATELFKEYTPEEVALLKGKNGKELRAEFIELAGILADYNEGTTGPGHCDEEPEAFFTGDTTNTLVTAVFTDRRIPLVA
jgi:hypothetical protein